MVIFHFNPDLNEQRMTLPESGAGNGSKYKGGWHEMSELWKQ